MNNQDDPFAMFRPQTNEKPQAPQDDPFYQLRPEYIKNQYKQVLPNTMFDGIDDDWTERSDRFNIDSPVNFQQKEKSRFEKPEFIENPLFKGSDDDWTERGDRFSVSAPVLPGAPRETGEALKSSISGLTFGASEIIPGLEVDEENYPEVSAFYKTLGSLNPLTKLHRAINNPLTQMAAKSPYLAKSLTSLAEIAGVGLTGMTEESIKEVFKGQVPSPEKILESGSDWVKFDLILKSLGKTGQFANWIKNKIKGTEKPSFEAINDFLTQMKKDGVDISNTDRVSAYVLSNLNKPVEKVSKGVQDIKLSSKKPSFEAESAQEALGLKPKDQMGSPFSPKSDVVKSPENKIYDIKNKKIEPLEYEKLSTNSLRFSEPYQPDQIDAQSAINKLNKTRANELMESVGERSPTKKTLGESVQKDINNGIKEAKKQHEPLYESVKEGSKNIKHKPETTIALAESILNNLNSLKVKPEGYKKVISTLNDSLADMGLYIENFGQNIGIVDVLGNKINFNPLRIIEEISVDKTIELAKRLNEIINYDLLDPSIKNVLKPISKSLKTEINETLKQKKPDLYQIYKNVESSFAESAKKFRNDPIKKIRGESQPEKISSKLVEPTTLESIKETVTPQTFKQIEREIIESIKDMSFENANKTYREIEPFLNKEAKDASRSIISEKSPYGKIKPSQDIKESIISDLNKAFNTNKRPETTLNLWKTIKGQNLINEALEGTPNKKEVLSYLKEQSLYDFSKSIVDNSGKIDFKKFNDLVKDPATIVNLRLMGGNDAVKFFNDLEQMSKIIKFNTKMIEKMPNVKLSPSKGTFKLGEEILEKTGQKNKLLTKEVEKFKEILPKKQESRKFIKGQETLDRAARKRQPFKFKMQDLSEKYNITPTMKGILYGLGLVKYTTASALIPIGTLLYKLASKPSTRSTFRMLLNTSKPKGGKSFDLTPFIKTLKKLDEELEN
jgi:hypothetical protein